MADDSPLLAPPEYYNFSEDLAQPFDIWSLGCTYLEFITWVLLGAEGVENFTQIRMDERGSRAHFKTDDFYKLVEAGGSWHAEAKESVKTVSCSYDATKWRND